MHKISFLIICISFFACGEEMQTNIIEGKLLNDCSNQAVGNVEVLLLDQSRQGKAIASDITASDGSFLLSYEMDEDKSGTAKISYFNGSFYETLMDGIPLNESYQLNPYINNSASIPLLVETTLTLNSDTLYYSLQSSNQLMRMQNPKDGTRDTLIQAIPNKLLGEVDDVLYWGLGTADFNKAEEALEIKDSTYHHISVKLASCKFSEQVLIKLE